MEKMVLYGENTGMPTRVLYSEKEGMAYTLDVGEPIEEIIISEGYHFLGFIGDTIDPEDLAKMLGVLFANTGDYRHQASIARHRINGSGLKVATRQFALEIKIVKTGDRDFPWKLEIKEKMTGRVFFTMPDLEEWEYGKTLATWFMSALTEMGVNLDFNYRIEKQ